MRTEESIADSLGNIARTNDEQAKGAERSPEALQCDPGDDQRDFDLCAQWKAADAAADAAWWAALGTWISGISGLLVIGALGLALQSNRIAQNTAKRELRAYLSVSPKGVFEREDDGWVRVPVFVHNHGHTPAFQASVTSWFDIVAEPSEFDPRPQQMAERDNVIIDSAIMYSPGAGEHLYLGLPFNLLPEFWNEVADKRLALVHAGVVRYQDAFGAARYTYFAHYHRGQELSDVEAKRCRFGNDGT